VEAHDKSVDLRKPERQTHSYELVTFARIFWHTVEVLSQSLFPVSQSWGIVGANVGFFVGFAVGASVGMSVGAGVGELVTGFRQVASRKLVMQAVKTGVLMSVLSHPDAATVIIPSGVAYREE
jgi:hypothetical protein